MRRSDACEQRADIRQSYKREQCTRASLSSRFIVELLFLPYQCWQIMSCSPNWFDTCQCQPASRLSEERIDTESMR